MKAHRGSSFEESDLQALSSSLQQGEAPRGVKSILLSSAEEVAIVTEKADAKEVQEWVIRTIAGLGSHTADEVRSLIRFSSKPALIDNRPFDAPATVRIV
jgi:hypothetical protein